MKICLVTPYDLSCHGGVSKHVLCLAAALRATGREVCVVGPRTDELPDDPDIRGFDGVVSIKANESDNRLGLLSSPLEVRRFMHERRFDVVHVHEPLVPFVAQYVVAASGDAARVATFHRYTEHEGRAGKLLRRALSPFLRPYHRGIAVSEPAARFARGSWSRELAIIPNGVDAGFFAPTAASAHSADDGALRLLFVGAWSDRRKGFDVLLDAVARMSARGIAVTLEVIGGGNGRNPAEGMPNVIFHGRVPEEMLRDRLRACDIFVAPSTGNESFGMVLVEAMAAGRPIVCGDIEGYRLVAPSEGAVFVQPKDAGALAEALSTLAADQVGRRRMGGFNRVAAQRYDWKFVAEQVSEQYAMALRSAGRGLRSSRFGLTPQPQPAASQSSRRRETV